MYVSMKGEIETYRLD